MEADAVSSRPESPKKKIKSNPVVDSEAQPSDYSLSTSNANNDHLDADIRINGIAPTRKYKVKTASAPDSSSERIQAARLTESDINVLQGEEISSSEVSSSVSRSNRGSCVTPAAGGADSICEPEDLSTVCDSASSVSSDRH